MDRRQIIKDLLIQYGQNDINFDVYVIADAQAQTVKESDNRIHHADESEFFSRREFAEIASALFYVFGFVRVFYSEISFIEYFIHNKINPRDCIVYNLARDGNRQGKKSLIPSFCDLYHIKYTGSDAFVISLLRNKAVFTDILSAHHIDVPISTIFSPTKGDVAEVCALLNGREIIIKNVHESASIGLTTNCKMLFSPQTYEKFFQVAAVVNPKQVLIQEFIDGIECEVLVLQYNGLYYAMDPVQITFPSDRNFLDSQLSNEYQYGFELLSGSMANDICATAEQAASILNIKDYARFDFRVRNGIPYIFDIAGTPYTIRHSSVAYLFGKYGLNYNDIYKAIVTCMISNYQQEAEEYNGQEF